jgi:hypothetical protein
MKMRNVYLTSLLLSIAFVTLSSFDTKPDTTMFNLLGYNVGLNLTHNIWVKVFGFTSLVLYLFNPTFKKSKA